MEPTLPWWCCIYCGGPHLNGNCVTNTDCDFCGEDQVDCICNGEWPTVEQPNLMGRTSSRLEDALSEFMRMSETLFQPQEQVMIESSPPSLRCIYCGGPHLNGNCVTNTYCDFCGEDRVCCICEAEWTTGEQPYHIEAPSSLEDTLAEFMHMSKTLFQPQEQEMINMGKPHEPQIDQPQHIESTPPSLSGNFCEEPHLNGKCVTHTFCDSCGEYLVECNCEDEWVTISENYPWLCTTNEEQEEQAPTKEESGEDKEDEEEEKIEMEEHVVWREDQSSQCGEGVKTQQEKTQQIMVPIILPSSKEDRSEEIDIYLDSFYALFITLHLKRVWKHLQLCFKFMMFLPQKRKKKDDVFFVSYQPP